MAKDKQQIIEEFDEAVNMRRKELEGPGAGHQSSEPVLRKKKVDSSSSRR